MSYKWNCLPPENAELLNEIEELRQDRSRWASRALAADRVMAKVQMARRRAAAALPPMPVIVGAPRSGTTLLRFMLDAHPALAIPPETGFLMQAQFLPAQPDAARRDLFELITHFPAEGPTWDDFGLTCNQLRDALDQIEPFDTSDGIRAFYRLYAAQQNKVRYGDKTPIYSLHLDTIRELLPEARFVHIIRDGRDTSLSLRPLWFAPGKDIASLAAQWKRFVLSARASATPRDYLEIRYEKLLTDTDSVLREVCSFLDLSFDAAMLHYFERTPKRLQQHVTRQTADGAVISHAQRLQQHTLTMQPPRRERINRWKSEMTAAEHAEFNTVAGDLLVELGYEVIRHEI
jgi:hypothetical protein